MIATEIHNYESTIRHCFETDKELLNIYHISAPADINICTHRTVKDLQKTNQFTFYSLRENDEIVGFFGKLMTTNVPMLESFFLKPNHRDEKTKDKFWDCVKEKVGDNFLCVIHKKNTRADNFLSKQKHDRIEDEKYIIYNIALN